MDATFAEIPAGLWARIQRWIPKRRRSPLGGRPPITDRRVMGGILYRLRTGCQWDAIPKEFGSRSTCYRRFVAWTAAGVFQTMHAEMLRYYQATRGIDWDWASLDSATVKAPKGGDLTGPNPTDRAKLGTKRHVLTDGRGVPLAVTVSGANVHDKRMAAPTLEAVLLTTPRGPRRPTNLCLDKGYDYADTEREVRRRRIVPHLRRRGEAARSCRRGRPRRWVVERTNSWHNNFRALRIRWETISAHYLALVQFACALIAYRAAMRRNGHGF